MNNLTGSGNPEPNHADHVIGHLGHSTVQELICKNDFFCHEIALNAYVG